MTEPISDIDLDQISRGSGPWPDAAVRQVLARMYRAEAEIERLRALLSWITGACVDELPHAEISAAVDRALETEERDD